jgi:ring-1,2-phenylacetyl-CoA epoxidase subunit PaaC
MSEHRKDVARYAMMLGDDSLVLGQRLGEWCGHAPTLEIDLALANIALDLIGQATLLLGHAGACEGDGRDADRIAFHRDVLDFTNCLLVEQPNGDFGRTIARQFLFSTWQHTLFQALSNSTDPTLAAIARKAVKEVAYHARVAGEWMVRLGDGTEDSHARLRDGLDWCWRFVDELFDGRDIDAALMADGIAVDPARLRPEFDARVDAVLRDAGLERPAERRPILGGRAGRHSEHLGHLLCEMQFLQRAYPDARW